jgi:signal transduction histidine kinase
MNSLARRIQFFIFMTILAVFALVASRWVYAQPGSDPNQALIASQAWWMDRSGGADLVTAQAVGEWTEFSGSKSFGFGTEAIWVKVRLKAAESSTGESWIVRVHPAYTDELTLYDPDHGRVLRAGRAVPPNGDDLWTISFSFPISAQTTERDIYIRQVSISSRNLRIEVMPASRAERVSSTEEWLLGAAITLSLLFSVSALLQWLSVREQVIGTFALKQFIAFVFSFFFLGFARLSLGPVLPPGTLTWMGSAVVAWLAAATAWFIALLLSPYQPWPSLVRALRLLALGFALLPLMIIAGYPREMLLITNITVPVGLLLILATAISARRAKTDQPIPLSWLTGYLALHGVLQLIPNLIHLGLMSGSYSIMIGNVTTAIFDGAVMFLVLQFRSRELRKRQHATELELIRSREQAAAEKRLREEQSQLLAMLAHEMKTPLATLRLWMDAGPLRRDAMDKTITDMNKIIERCVHTGQLADQALRPDVQTVDGKELTQTCIQACPDPTRVAFRFDNTEASLRSDAQILAIVLGNLLDNACKYSAPGTPVEISLERSTHQGQDGWLWRVHNQPGAAGLPDVSRLFEKYYRGPHARRQSGSGLGLFLVRGLLELLGGSVHHEPQADRIVFSVWVPAQTPSVGNRWD